jgi:hypothetical protein
MTICIQVGVPYLKTKLDEAFEKARGGAAADLFGEEEFETEIETEEETHERQRLLAQHPRFSRQVISCTRTIFTTCQHKFNSIH